MTDAHSYLLLSIIFSVKSMQDIHREGELMIPMRALEMNNE